MKKISGRNSKIYKTFISTLFIIQVVFVIFFGRYINRGGLFPIGYFFMLLMIPGIIYWIWILRISSINVYLSEDGIYIKSKSNNDKILFNNIRSVTGGWLGSPVMPWEEVVRLNFIENTIFGESIKFYPEWNMSIMRKQHGIVHKIEALLEHNKPINADRATILPDRS